MYFALDVLFDAEPRMPVGAPLADAKEWWLDNRWMPNVFRDYLFRCEARGDDMTFGPSLSAAGASPQGADQEISQHDHSSGRDEAHQGDRRRERTAGRIG